MATCPRDQLIRLRLHTTLSDPRSNLHTEHKCKCFRERVHSHWQLEDGCAFGPESVWTVSTAEVILTVRVVISDLR
jgi:hypothetical protein